MYPAPYDGQATFEFQLARRMQTVNSKAKPGPANGMAPQVVFHAAADGRHRDNERQRPSGSTFLFGDENQFGPCKTKVNLERSSPLGAGSSAKNVA
jgi:hypothetical protein